jgi:hypothetical protein
VTRKEIWENIVSMRLRKEANKNIVKKDNCELYAGSPMYYYCRSCNEEMALPECHTCAIPKLCRDCQALDDVGALKYNG